MDIRAALKKWVNPALIIVIVLLVAYGTILVIAAVQGYEDSASMIQKQFIGIALGIVGATVVWAFDYRKLNDWWIPLLIAVCMLILLPKVPGLGIKGGGGETLWVGIAGRTLFQPSEPAKILTIVLLASVVAHQDGHIERVRDFARILLIAFVPFALMIIQGDLGTGLVTLAILMGILLMGGVKAKHLLIMITIGVAAIAGILWLNSALGTDAAGEHKLIKNYQLDRLTVFLNPEEDKSGAGYNLEQSKISIGSGELTGHGLKGGTQSTLSFLPVRYSDFIFAVLGEKLGFVGGIALLALYLALLLVSLSIGRSSDDLFGTLIVVGVIAMWLFQILENAGMAMGLMPITGIPLPFMSYGSSALVTNLVCVGLLGSVWSRRPYLSSPREVRHGFAR